MICPLSLYLTPVLAFGGTPGDVALRAADLAASASIITWSNSSAVGPGGGGRLGTDGAGCLGGGGRVVEFHVGGPA